MTKQKAKQTKKSRGGMGVRKDAPAATSRRVVTSAYGPTITRSSSGCRIKHREFVTSVTLPYAGSIPYSGLFWARSWAVNPGLASPFPWLAAIANQYELYRFHSLKFRYVTRSGTSAGGTVRMAFDHDAKDEDPMSTDVVMSYAGATADVIWKDQTLDVPASRLNLGMPNGRYTRMGVHLAEDLKTYDCGKFILALSGWGTVTEIGEIHVEYDVELSVPQLRTGVSSGVFKSGLVQQPSASALDLRLIAVADRAAAAVGGTVPVELTERTNPVSGEVVNILKFLAPFTGEITSDVIAAVGGVGSVPPGAGITIEEDPSGSSSLVEKLAYRETPPSAAVLGKAFNRWLGDIKAGTILKLIRAGPYLGNTIGSALLAFKLLDKSAFGKYEL